MSASVLPYAKVLNDGEEIDYIVIKFTGFNSNILFYEVYCVNPGCSCANAVLRFIKLSEDGEPVNDWFEIRLNMHTWKVTEKKILNKMLHKIMKTLHGIQVIRKAMFILISLMLFYQNSVSYFQ